MGGIQLAAMQLLQIGKKKKEKYWIGNSNVRVTIPNINKWITGIAIDSNMDLEDSIKLLQLD